MLRPESATAPSFYLFLIGAFGVESSSPASKVELRIRLGWNHQGWLVILKLKMVTIGLARQAKIPAKR